MPADTFSDHSPNSGALIQGPGPNGAY